MGHENRIAFVIFVENEPRSDKSNNTIPKMWQFSLKIHKSKPISVAIIKRRRKKKWEIQTNYPYLSHLNRHENVPILSIVFFLQVCSRILQNFHFRILRAYRVICDLVHMLVCRWCIVTGPYTRSWNSDRKIRRHL